MSRVELWLWQECICTYLTVRLTQSAQMLALAVNFLSLPTQSVALPATSNYSENVTLGLLACCLKIQKFLHHGKAASMSLHLTNI